MAYISFFRYNSTVKNDTIYAIIGIPLDYGTTQEFGYTKEAPSIIRELSDHISLMTEREVYFNENLPLVDLGDIVINSNNIDSNNDQTNLNSNNTSFGKETKIYELKLMNNLVEQIKNKLKYIYKNLESSNLKENKRIPIFIGGNHLVTFPILKSLEEFQSLSNISVISLDAHLDFYDIWQGNKYQHCTVMKRIHELLKNYSNNKLVIIGTRDIDIEEFQNAKSSNFSNNYLNCYEIFKKSKIHNKNVSEVIFEFINNILKSDGDNPKTNKVYISIDIDIFDPSIAPATGYPIAGGLLYRDVLDLLEKLVNSYEIIGIDLVEYMPNLDFKNMMTGFLCTRLIQEIIGFLELKRKRAEEYNEKGN